MQMKGLYSFSTYTNLLTNHIHAMFTNNFTVYENHLLISWGVVRKVLVQLSVPGRSTNLDYSRARAYSACSGCGWGVVWTFFLSSTFSLFFLPLFGRRSDID